MSDFSKQMKKQNQLDGEALRRSFEKLAESVGDDRVTRLFGADDLEMADGAIRACLRYCGAKPGNIPEGVTDLEERNHDTPHRTQKSKERGKVRARSQEAEVAVFGKA